MIVFIVSVTVMMIFMGWVINTLLTAVSGLQQEVLELTEKYYQLQTQILTQEEIKKAYESILK